MSTRKPLVLVSGQVAQFQTGDLLTVDSLIESGGATPTALVSATTNNDWAPPGFTSARVIRLGATGAGTVTITGIAGGADGRVITIVNITADATVVLFSMDDALSAAANRITGTATAQYITQGGAITLRYDGTSLRWRVIEVQSSSLTITQILTALSITGALTTANSALGGANAFSSSLTPTALSGSVNDYAPTGIGATTTIHQDASVNSTLTGLSAVTTSINNNGRVLIIENVSTTSTITLKHESSSSAAANRFTLPGATDYVIASGAGVICRYRNGTTRWRVIS